MDWKVYYGDGSTFSDEDGSPELAPSNDVQVIASADEMVGRFLLSRFDYYWFQTDENRWYGGDLFGLYDHLQQPGWRKVLFGRYISNVRYNEIVARAVQDSDLPEKSAWTDAEHRPEGGDG